MTIEIKPHVSLSRRSEEEYQSTTEIYGTVQDRLSRVHDAFAKNLDTGQDIGALVAMFIDGEPVSLLSEGYPIKPKGSKFYERALLNPQVTPQVTWSLPWHRAEAAAPLTSISAEVPAMKGHDEHTGYLSNSDRGRTE